MVKHKDSSGYRSLFSHQHSSLTKLQHKINKRPDFSELWLAFAPKQCHKRSAMLEDAVYSPDVTPCNLFLFLNLKNWLK